jgi:hypothetical protein
MRVCCVPRPRLCDTLTPATNSPAATARHLQGGHLIALKWNSSGGLALAQALVLQEDDAQKTSAKDKCYSSHTLSDDAGGLSRLGPAVHEHQQGNIMNIGNPADLPPAQHAV